MKLSIAIGFFVLLGIMILKNMVLKRKSKLHLLERKENESTIQELRNDNTKAALLQQVTELELQALRAQMNPHFIFNCFSSINRFILKNQPESASDYLTKFSKLIRMVLNNSKHTFITLNEELDCLELYMQMEQLRFKNSFRYKIECATNIDAEGMLVPPLLLQPFVENAIWHGLMNKDNSEGIIDIFLQQREEILECVITDNGAGRRAAAEPGTKHSTDDSMGTQITRKRMALLSGKGEHSIEVEDLYDDIGNASGTRVRLKIRYKKTIERKYL